MEQILYHQINIHFEVIAPKKNLQQGISWA